MIQKRYQVSIKLLLIGIVTNNFTSQSQIGVDEGRKTDTDEHTLIIENMMKSDMEKLITSLQMKIKALTTEKNLLTLKNSR